MSSIEPDNDFDDEVITVLSLKSLLINQNSRKPKRRIPAGKKMSHNVLLNIASIMTLYYDTPQ